MMLRLTLSVLALAASSLAWGQALEPPERIAQLSYVEGPITFAGAQEPPNSTLPDRPLAPGDRLVTERGGRAELSLGMAVVRLDERTVLSIVTLDETTVRAELAAGSASVYVRDLYEDDTFEIATPHGAVAFDEPGEYRLDVSADDTTALTVRAGLASVATAGGPVRVSEGQRVRLDGRDSFAQLENAQPADAFDEWVLEREVKVAEAEPPRYTPYEGEQYVEGEKYEELENYGEWYDEPRYGRVWMPAYAYGGYAPFRYGHWRRVGFGWSWVDPFPWGTFTFHHGRWAFLHHVNRWCWVPGRRFHHWRHFDHQRRFVQETSPYRRPRDERRSRDDRDDRPRDVRSREQGEDVLRRVLWRSDPKKERRSDEPSRREPLRFGTDRRPTFVADRNSGSSKRPTGGTYTPSRSSGQSSSGNSNSSNSSTSSNSRRQSTSRSTSNSNSNRSVFGARYNEP